MSNSEVLREQNKLSNEIDQLVLKKKRGSFKIKNQEN